MTTFDSTPPTGATEFPLGRYTVLNALQLDLIECPADADVRSVARTMAEHTVHCVVVRNLESGVWGIVSDLDLMAAMRPELADATAGQLAATDPLTVGPADTLSARRSSWPSTRHRTPSWSIRSRASPSGSSRRSTWRAGRRSEGFRLGARWGRIGVIDPSRPRLPLLPEAAVESQTGVAPRRV